MIKFLPAGLTRQVGRALLVTKKNSPHIFFAGGIVGSVTSTFLACKATLKLEQTVDEIKEDFKNVRELKENLTIENYSRDLQFVYIKSAKTMITLYGPSVLLGTASIAALTGSHIQLTRRNAAVSATLAAVSKAFNDYRDRVREEIGEKRELDIYRGMHDKELDVDGKKKLVQVADPSRHSPYARFFDEANRNWVKNAEINKIFIMAQQNYLNDLLQARGHVFLNDVYDALGFERSQAGQVVGWVRNGNGDGYIDFQMFDGNPSSKMFVNGQERSILLDFNVDGVVYNLI